MGAVNITILVHITILMKAVWRTQGTHAQHARAAVPLAVPTWLGGGAGAGASPPGQFFVSPPAFSCVCGVRFMGMAAPAWRSVMCVASGDLNY